MKNSKRILSLCLAALMVAALMLPAAVAEEGQLEPLKFTVTTVSFGGNPTGKLFQEEWLKMCSRLVGRDLQPEYNFINVADYWEKIRILCASGEIPDILTIGWGLDQNDVLAYGEAGMFEELTQHMDQLPNYKTALDGDPKAQNKLFSEDGKLYAFYNAAFQGDQGEFATAYDWGNAAVIRKDIFDKNNIALPNTVEEFTEAARKLKEIYPDVYPMGIYQEWQQPIITLASANRTKCGEYYNGEKFVYGPTEDSYKEALMVLNTWYTEGLISPDFFVHTTDDGQRAVAEGKAFMFPSCAIMEPANIEKDHPDQEWALLPKLVNEKYGEPLGLSCANRGAWNVYNGYSVVLSSQAKEKDALLKFLDARYNPEVVDLMAWGIEGITYKVNENGGREFLPEVKSPDKCAEMAFKGYSCRAGIFPEASSVESSAAMNPTLNIFYDNEYHENIKWLDYSVAQYDNLCDYADFIESTPLSSEEAEEFSEIMTAVRTFTEEQRAMFVKGERSFDEWDNYLEEMKKIGDIDYAMELLTAHVVK